MKHETTQQARSRIKARLAELLAQEQALRAPCGANNPLPYAQINPILRERRGLRDEWEALNV